MKARYTRVVWCAVGPEEQKKCQQWSQQSGQNVTCATASTTDDCIVLVLVGGLLPACKLCGWGAQVTASGWRGAGAQRCSAPRGAGAARAACPEWGQTELSVLQSVYCGLPTLLILRTTHNECR